MNYTKITLPTGEVIDIRPFSIKHYHALHKMHALLSDESKDCFRSNTIYPRPLALNPIDVLVWSANKVRLALSTCDLMRFILSYLPEAAVFSFVAVNSLGEVVGFLYISVIGHRFGHKNIGELGVVVRDDYQGTKLGTKFIRASLGLSSRYFELVIAEAFNWNSRAIHVYETLGFTRAGNTVDGNGNSVCLLAYLDAEAATARRQKNGSK